MKNNHQNRCKNKNIKKQKTHFLHLGASFLYVDFRSEKHRLSRGYIDHPMNISTYWSSEVNGQRRLRTTGTNKEVMG
jgi:hypothetical protein